MKDALSDMTSRSVGKRLVTGFAAFTTDLPRRKLNPTPFEPLWPDGTIVETSRRDGARKRYAKKKGGK